MNNLTENTLYINDEEKQLLLANKKTTADIVFLNYIGFLALYSINLKGKIKQYRFLEGEIKQAKDIDDTNMDVSISLKLAYEAGLFPNVALIRFTRILAKIKQGSIKPKDITNDMLKDLYTIDRFGTSVKLSPKVKAIADRWMTGEIDHQDIPKEIFKISKLPTYTNLLGDYYNFYKRSNIAEFYNKKGYEFDEPTDHKPVQHEINDIEKVYNIVSSVPSNENWERYFAQLEYQKDDLLSKPVDKAWQTRNKIFVKTKYDEYIADTCLMYRKIPNIYRTQLNQLLVDSFKRTDFNVDFWKSDFNNTYNYKAREYVINNINDNIAVLVSTPQMKYESIKSKFKLDEVKKIYSLLSTKDYKNVSLEFYSELDKFNLFTDSLVTKFLNHFAERLNQNDVTIKAIRLFIKCAVNTKTGSKILVTSIIDNLSFVMKNNSFGLTEYDKMSMVMSTIKNGVLNKSEIMDSLIKLYININGQSKIPKRVILYLISKTDNSDLISVLMEKLIKINSIMFFNDDDIKFYSVNLPNMSQTAIKLLVDELNKVVAGTKFSEAELKIRNKDYIKLAMFANNVLKYYSKTYEKVDFVLDKSALYEACQKIATRQHIMKYFNINDVNIKEIDDMVEKFEMYKQTKIKGTPVDLLTKAVNNGEFEIERTVPFSRSMVLKTNELGLAVTRKFYSGMEIPDGAPLIQDEYNNGTNGETISYYVATESEAKILSKIIIDNPYRAPLADILKIVTSDKDFYLVKYNDKGDCTGYFKCTKMSKGELSQI